MVHRSTNHDSATNAEQVLRMPVTCNWRMYGCMHVCMHMCTVCMYANNCWQHHLNSSFSLICQHFHRIPMTADFLTSVVNRLDIVVTKFATAEKTQTALSDWLSLRFWLWSHRLYHLLCSRFTRTENFYHYQDHDRPNRNYTKYYRKQMEIDWPHQRRWSAIS